MCSSGESENLSVQVFLVFLDNDKEFMKRPTKVTEAYGIISQIKLTI